MVDARCNNPLLELPTEQPDAVEAWSHVKLNDRRVKLVLEKMKADLRPGNLSAVKLSRTTLLREFLSHRVAPLQAHSRQLCRLEDADVVLCLSLDSLNDEDLSAALRFLVREDVAGLVDAPVPLFLRDD